MIKPDWIWGRIQNNPQMLHAPQTKTTQNNIKNYPQTHDIHIFTTIWCFSENIITTILPTIAPSSYHLIHIYFCVYIHSLIHIYIYMICMMKGKLQEQRRIRGLEKTYRRASTTAMAADFWGFGFGVCGFCFLMSSVAKLKRRRFTNGLNWNQAWPIKIFAARIGPKSGGPFGARFPTCLSHYPLHSRKPDSGEFQTLSLYRSFSPFSLSSSIRFVLFPLLDSSFSVSIFFPFSFSFSFSFSSLLISLQRENFCSRI